MQATLCPAYVPHGYNGQGKIDNPTRRAKATPSLRDPVARPQCVVLTKAFDKE